MTSQSLRIYLYKITFEEVPYYYYGVHKEKRYDEYYMGSPYTHKWCWELYTPKKQILQLFDFTDEGWLEAQEVEKRLIKSFYNSDKWCLNENCGGLFSLIHQKINGKKGSKRAKELGVGIYSLSREKLIEQGRKCGNVYGTKNYKEGKGLASISKEERHQISKMVGKKTYELKIGVHSLTKEQKIEIGKKAAKNTNSQKWMCLETGHISTSGPLTLYQKKRGINVSKRKRLDIE